MKYSHAPRTECASFHLCPAALFPDVQEVWLPKDDTCQYVGFRIRVQGLGFKAQDVGFRSNSF